MAASSRRWRALGYRRGAARLCTTRAGEIGFAGKLERKRGCEELTQQILPALEAQRNHLPSALKVKRLQEFYSRKKTRRYVKEAVERISAGANGTSNSVYVYCDSVSDIESKTSSAASFLVLAENGTESLLEGSLFFSRFTDSQAHFAAAIDGLAAAFALEASQVTLVSESKFALERLSGVEPVTAKKLQRLLPVVRLFRKKFAEMDFICVSRDDQGFQRARKLSHFALGAKKSKRYLGPASLES